MGNESRSNVHDIIRTYSLPISRGDLSIKDCLRSYFSDFYLDLKEAVATNYPDDFPSDFYNDLLNKNLPIISKECKMILDILKLDNQDCQLEKLNKLMIYMLSQDALRLDKFDEGDLMARIRPGKGFNERKELFHIPYTDRERASAQRFSIPGNPCLYLSVYRGFKPHNYEMTKAAWIECGMPSPFTYCIFELQKELNVLHFGKSGPEYLFEYDHAKNEDIEKDRLEAITQYLLSFPMRAACLISVENKSEKNNDKNYDEYLFPQLLMQWLQKYSTLDGVIYQGASSNTAQRGLYIGNLAIPTRNISAENEYDPYLKECFKLSDPQVKDLTKDFNSDEMKQKTEALKRYTENLEQILIQQDVPSNHPYTDLSLHCHSLQRIYSQMRSEKICTFYEEFVSLYEISQTIETNIMNCKTAEEWIDRYNQHDNSKPLTDEDFENILIPFQNIVMSVCKEIKRIFYLQDCGSLLMNMNFQKI